MKRNVYAMILATALIVLSAGTTRAGDAFNRPGPYLGIGPSGALTNFSGDFSGFGNSYGANFRGGYRFNDYLAIEGLYEYMDDFGASRTSRNLQRKASASIQTHNFSLLAKVIFPTLGLPQLQPFVMGGIGFLNANGSGKLEVRGTTVAEDIEAPSDTEFAGRVDGGVDYFFTPELSTFFDVGYVIPTGDLSGMNYLSLGAGVKYSF
ncbi:MAG: porin family protein [Gammaproteobacteria bacterium]